jgi:hypothetical protein
VARRQRRPERAPKRPPRRRPAAQLRERERRRARRLGYQIQQLIEAEPKKTTALVRTRRGDLVASDQIESVRPVAVYDSLEEAQMAMARIHDRDLLQEHREAASRSGFSVGLAVGLSVVAVLGVGLVLVYVLFRRRENESPQAYQGPVSAPPQVIHISGNGAGQVELPSTHAITKAITDALTGPQRDMRTFMRSYTLPSLTNFRSEAIRIATAGKQPYEVVVRAIEPPGGHAVVSFDANELNMVGHLPSVSTLSTNFSAFPIGDVLVIPTGQFQPIRLRPGQVLYAKGTVAPNASTGVKGVIISVSAADFIVGR